MTEPNLSYPILGPWPCQFSELFLTSALLLYIIDVYIIYMQID